MFSDFGLAPFIALFVILFFIGYLFRKQLKKPLNLLVIYLLLWLLMTFFLVTNPSSDGRSSMWLPFYLFSFLIINQAWILWRDHKGLPKREPLAAKHPVAAFFAVFIPAILILIYINGFLPYDALNTWWSSLLFLTIAMLGGTCSDFLARKVMDYLDAK
ncbi:hypothetical protein [Fructobacillus papyrifericola]|uniref:Uncharacterized protein n=1 Tax=Fructobacillus papyrifericola TaxID=2713172 RepID=A0ABS5QU04_9LACO|nr:hypothetical protein [Fructobacillus papyrifericola]MBS9336669.1 hypothetical protein [Fructobacillus papyrifericola]